MPVDITLVNTQHSDGEIAFFQSQAVCLWGECGVAKNMLVDFEAIIELDPRQLAEFALGQDNLQSEIHGFILKWLVERAAVDGRPFNLGGNVDAELPEQDELHRC